jgi:hypothetical protein
MVVLNAAGAQAGKAKGLERALPREELLLRHLISATRLLECDRASGNRCHDRGFAASHPPPGVRGGSSVMDGIRAIACQPLFGRRHYGPERPKHPPPSGDSPLTQPFACSHIIFERCAVCGGNGALRSESAGSRTARDAFRADERGHSGLILILRHDRHPLSPTTGKKGNISRPACGWSRATLLARQSPLGLEPPLSGCSEEGRCQIIQAAITAIGELLDSP